MRSSDWISDVCSSDLAFHQLGQRVVVKHRHAGFRRAWRDIAAPADLRLVGARLADADALAVGAAAAAALGHAAVLGAHLLGVVGTSVDRKSTRLNSSP